MKVGLFGGSFNPIHNGHLQIVNEIIYKNIVDEVWFIPCGNHPFNKQLVQGKNRINMIKLGIEGNQKLRVLTIEALSEKTSFTSETVKYLRNQFKEIEFYFILGADNLINLQKWHDFEYLKNNIKFIVVKRSKFRLKNKLGIKIDYTLEMENTVSSTIIRKAINNRKSISSLVPEKIERYIKQEDLYNEKSLCKPSEYC